VTPRHGPCNPADIDDPIPGEFSALTAGTQDHTVDDVFNRLTDDCHNEQHLHSSKMMKIGRLLSTRIKRAWFSPADTELNGNWKNENADSMNSDATS
jgi:hypothetical protein